MRQTRLDHCHSETHIQMLTAHHNDTDLDLCPFLLPLSCVYVCVCCALSHQIKRWHINFSHQPCTSLPPATVSLSVCVDMCLVVAAATLPNWGCHRLLRPEQRVRERGMSNGMSPLCRLSLGSMLQFGWVRGSNRTRNVNDDHDLWVNTLSLAVVNCTGCQ